MAIKGLVKVYGGTRLNLTKNVVRELGITKDTVMQMTVEDGVMKLEPVEIVIKKKKKKKADKREKE